MFNLPFSFISQAKLKELEDAAAAARKKTAELNELLKAQRGIAGAVLKSMAEGVLAVDGEGRIILANLAIEKMFGVIEPEILGKTVRMGIHNNEVADLIEEAGALGKTVEKEINILVPIEGTFAALAGPIQKEGGIVCVLHDMTELRKLERHRSEFVANVSHELKTPLTAIRNYVETLILGAINDKENNLGFAKKIDKHAQGLSALIDDILEIANLEAKKELGPFAVIDAAKVVEHALEAVTGKARKKSVEIIKELQGANLHISGIEEHVYRAVLNLLDNAVNYTASGGKVMITAEKKDGKVEITVSDNGIGIPAEHLPRIFERFYRVDRARSRELGGTGLGLAIVKHVMNLHNGEVLAESNEGRGSKFTLVFPA